MIGAAQEKRWGESILHSKDDRNGFGIWLWAGTVRELP
jgi:hypothetical protein